MQVMIIIASSHLRDEAKENNHADARYDVRMVLDDEFVAEHRRAFFVVRSSQHCF